MVAEYVVNGSVVDRRIVRYARSRYQNGLSGGQKPEEHEQPAPIEKPSFQAQHPLTKAREISHARQEFRQGQPPADPESLPQPFTEGRTAGVTEVSPDDLGKPVQQPLPVPPKAPPSSRPEPELRVRKETKLAGREYKELGTRSPAFKEWFGDWEKEPRKASKVVDRDTGDPKETYHIKKVYHGGSGRFEAFDPEMKGMRGGIVVGKGFYFAENKKVAQTFARVRSRAGDQGSMVEAYLNIREPFDFEEHFDQDSFQRIHRELLGWMQREEFGRDTARSANRFFTSKTNNNPEGMQGATLWTILSRVVDRAHVNEFLEHIGYDGIVHESTDEWGTPALEGGSGSYGRCWVAFRPNQIKAVKNRGTFDPEDDRIKYGSMQTMRHMGILRPKYAASAGPERYGSMPTMNTMGRRRHLRKQVYAALTRYADGLKTEEEPPPETVRSKPQELQPGPTFPKSTVLVRTTEPGKPDPSAPPLSMQRRPEGVAGPVPPLPEPFSTEAERPEVMQSLSTHGSRPVQRSLEDLGRHIEDRDRRLDARREYKRLGTYSRTFMRWFGDFVNDPENASKVVDVLTKEPKETYKVAKVFHGTGSRRFSAFDPTKIGRTASVVGKGLYFTESEEVAHNFQRDFGTQKRGGHIIEAYLNIRKPLDFDQYFYKSVFKNEVAEKLAEWMKQHKLWWVPSAEDLTTGVKDRLIAKFRSFVGDDDTISGHQLWNFLSQYSGSEVNQLVEKLGYDGIAFSGDDYGDPVGRRGDQKYFGKCWVAFKPNQVKLVKNRGTFDPNDDRMRYRYGSMQSMRFRYQDAETEPRKSEQVTPLQAEPVTPKPTQETEPKLPPRPAAAAYLPKPFAETEPTAPEHRTGAGLAESLATRPVQPATAEPSKRPAPEPRKEPTEEESVATAEREYKAEGTRSPSFLKWFGDTKTDPRHASKVVNTRGEPHPTSPIPGNGKWIRRRDRAPVAVYHGTAAGGYDAFDKKFIGSNNLYGSGFYFTENEDIARSYVKKPASTLSVDQEKLAEAKRFFASVASRATPEDEERIEWAVRTPGIGRGYLIGMARELGLEDPQIKHLVGIVESSIPKAPQVMKFYLNIRNPLNMDRKVSDQTVRRIAQAMEAEGFSPFKWRWMKPRPGSTGDAVWNSMIKQIETADKHLGRAREDKPEKVVNQILQKAGFDGITHIGGSVAGMGKLKHRVWVAFEPNQIKLVDNRGTFNPEDDRFAYRYGAIATMRKMGRRKQVYASDQPEPQRQHETAPEPGKSELLTSRLGKNIGMEPQAEEPPRRPRQLPLPFVHEPEREYPKALRKEPEPEAALPESLVAGPKPKPREQPVEAEVRLAQREYKAMGTRAPAFKRWFGDYEKNPDEASKVVHHDSGEPAETYGVKVKGVFHGTMSQPFEAFDPERKGSKGGTVVGRGFYFAEDRRIAETWGSGRGHVVEVYLNIRNPFRFDSQFTLGQVKGIVQRLSESAKKPEMYDLVLANLASVQRAKKGTIWGQDLWRILAWDEAIGWNGVNDRIESLGFDGIEHQASDKAGGFRKPGEPGEYGRVWVAFRPEQIKAIDNIGTFDPKNAKMRYRARA
jgi:hypothetical protein